MKAVKDWLSWPDVKIEKIQKTFFKLLKYYLVNSFQIINIS